MKKEITNSPAFTYDDLIGQISTSYTSAQTKASSAVNAGFSLSNLKRMRQLYGIYPISAKPSHQLSWSHYVELLKIDDPLERNFSRNLITCPRPILKVGF
jgi:hypothetical protein